MNKPMDPVCGMTPDPLNPKGGRAVHDGREYVFCSAHCRDHFVADPSAYMEAEDPVSGARVRRDSAPGGSFWHDSKAWFFGSEEHRLAFEAAPERFGAAPLEPAEADPQAVHWCPMDPEVEQVGPGVCPKCGMALEPKFPGAEEAANSELEDMKRRLLVAGSFSLPLLALAMGPMLLPGRLPHWAHGSAAAWLQLALAAPAVLWGGAPFFRRAWLSLKTRHLNMFTLIGLGTGAAFGFSLAGLLFPGAFPQEALDPMTGRPGLYFESSAVIIALVALGQVLELSARSRTGSALRSLLKMAPERAERLKADGAAEEVALEAVAVGMRLRVKPGGRVPVDGVLLEGASWVDESLLTGEPDPVEKGPGSEVAGGTLNGPGAFVMEARRVGKDTALARIVALVSEAARSRSPLQRLADRVSAVFVPAVALASALAFLAWAAFGPEPRLAYSLLAAVSVLIIACPCALGLATPMSVTVGMGRAAEQGVLFKDAEALEALAQVDVVLLDKTGTLTLGHPALVGLASLDLPEEGLLRLAAAAEALSEHPFGRAVAAGAAARGLSLPRGEGFRAFAGSGLEARVEGKTLLVGSAAFLRERGVEPAALEAEGEGRQRQGQSLAFVAVDGRLAGWLAVADPLRHGSAAAVASLKRRGLEVRMLTGDDALTAGAVAREAGIAVVHAGMTPEGKAQVVAGLKAKGRRVAMVGEGMNDAPALALADVGVGLAHGTDVAVQAGQVTLVGGDLRALVRAVKLARRVRRNIKQNLFWAFAYNALGVPLAGGALVPLLGMDALLSPMLAAAAMSFSSVSVILNALRLRRA